MDQKDIRALVFKDTTFLNGKKYWEEGHVRDLDIDEIYDNEYIVSGYVDSAKAPLGYQCMTRITNGHLTKYRCSCPANYEFPGICKHIVAILLGFAYEQGGGEQILRDFWAESLLRPYVDDNEEFTYKKKQGEVKLKPKLVLEYGMKEFKVEFMIGIQRDYVLKSTGDFAENLRQGLRFKYGKELEFIHGLDAFEDHSKKLAQLILDVDNAFNSFNHASTYAYASKSSVLGRRMVLPANKFDEFFDLYAGKQLPYTFYGTNEGEIQFTEDRPYLRLELKEDKGRYSLAINKGHYITYTTDQFGYIIGQEHLYRCQKKYARKVFPVLNAFEQKSDQVIYFNREEVQQFLAFVYPKVKEQIKISAPQELMDELAPKPLMTDIYVDYPSVNKIRARVDFSYGDYKFDPHREEPDQKLIRDMLGEKRILSLFDHLGFQYSDGYYYLAGEEEIYTFLTEEINELLPLAQVYLEDNLEKLKAKKNFSVGMSVSVSNGKLSIKFDDTFFGKEELLEVLRAYRKGKKYIILNGSTFVDINTEAARIMATVVEDFDITDKELTKEELILPQYRAVYLNKLLEEQEGLQVEKNKDYKSLVRDIEKPVDTDFMVPDSLKSILRSYQVTGYRWLKTLSHYGFGGILADDMGLGKTLQVIALLLSEQGEVDKPSLIVAPTSLVFNWQAELKKFAPQLKFLFVGGNSEQRKALIGQMKDYDVLITSYDMLKRDIVQYEEAQFRFCIADEAQYIKNHNTQNAQALKLIKSEVRFALTGTPIENSLADLWSIMDFVMPGYFFNWTKFKAVYEAPIVKYEDKMRLRKLQKQIAPFLLRRVKSEVLKELPPKIETTMYAEMTKEETKLYHAYLAQAKKEFAKEVEERGYGQSQIKILSLLTRLRQICCHPGLFLENFEGEGSKLKLCMELVKEKVERGSKVIIFSQFTSMLDVIANQLRAEGIEPLLLTGSTKTETRMRMVDEFNHEEAPVFLISLKAGGVGLNLVAADTVIHYDPWWNLSAQNQATDRAYRMGQDKTVHVIKLIAKNTIEEKIQELQEKKQDLTESIVQEGSTFITKLDQRDMEQLFVEV